jgi:hypothetical protein
MKNKDATITMSLHDYEMVKVENELLIQENERLKEGNTVFLSSERQNHWNGTEYRLSGTLVEKDALLKKMQEHLDASKVKVRKIVIKEFNYKQRISELEYEIEELKKPFSLNVKSTWWGKLISKF